MLYPMKLAPVFKEYIWGGTKLKNKYGKKTDLSTVAESWELTIRPEGTSIVLNGDDAGRSLSDVIASSDANILGDAAKKFDEFPLLLKFIDAAKDLSVQVHPDDEYARNYPGEHGKTELWYIIEAKQGSSIIYGLKRETTREELQQRIEDNTLEDVLNRVPVNAGDVFLIEAGTIHSIGKGIVLAEVQQNSNTTYRVYDYGRLGNDGKPRELNVKKALDVINTSPAPVLRLPPNMTTFADYETQLLTSCKYFTSYLVNLHGKCRPTAGEGSFQSLLMISGNITIDYNAGEESFKKGDSVFIPAGLGKYRLRGKGKFIITTL